MAGAGASAQPAGPGTVAPVSFEDAVVLAQEQAYAVTAAEVDAEVARAEVDAVEAERWPALSLSAGAGQRYGLGFDQTAGTLTQTRVEALDVALSANYVVFDGFERRSRLRSAEASVLAAAFDAERARQRVVGEVVRGYLAVSQAEAAVTVVSAEIEAQGRIGEELRALVDLGVRPAYEVDLHESRVATVRMRLLEVQRDRELAEAYLVRLLGLDPVGAYAFPVPSARGDGPDVPTDTLLRRAVHARPDLVAADLAIRAARADRRAATATRLPRIALVGGVGSNYTSANDAVGLTDQLGGNRAGSLGFRISVPLLDRGSARRSIRRADLRVASLENAAEDLRREAVLEVRERQIDLRALLGLREAAGARATALSAALTAEDARYRSGTATFQAVAQLRAQRVDALAEQARLDVAIQFQRFMIGLLTTRDPSLATGQAGHGEVVSRPTVD